LRAAVEWSYHLLAPAVQQFFTRLSIFRGGWSLEAAEAICGEGDGGWGLGVGGSEPGPNAQPPTPSPAARVPSQPPTPILEHLTELREASMVVAEEAETGMRYRLLETVREFAAEQLPREAHAALARRHLQYFDSIAGGERYHRGGDWRSQEHV